MSQLLQMSKNNDPKASYPRACPNCGGGRGMEVIYSINDVPVHSTVNLSSRDEALKFPTGDLRLGFCDACGFLGNIVYDASLQDYCQNCEESQHVSPTFNKFAQELATRWIDQYRLRGKTILGSAAARGSSWR
jgi:hypothetical protein